MFGINTTVWRVLGFVAYQEDRKQQLRLNIRVIYEHGKFFSNTQRTMIILFYVNNVFSTNVEHTLFEGFCVGNTICASIRIVRCVRDGRALR